MWERIQAMRARFEEIEAQMATPEVARNPRRLHELARERSQLEPLISMLAEYRKATDDLEQAREVLAEADDEEFRAMAQSEIETLSAQIERLGEDARRALLPKDPNDERNVIIEIRAGTGGDEAGLWAGDLYRAYSRYADAQHWKTSVISANTTPTGGFKEIVFQVNGKGAFSRFKYESGVHRVQRVPATEAQGRIHTSTATVAVLPEVEDLDFTIDPSEIRMDRFHSGGAGRAERQQGRDGDSSDTRTHGHRRDLHGRALAAQESNQGHVGPQGAALRPGDAASRRGALRGAPLTGGPRAARREDPHLQLP